MWVKDHVDDSDYGKCPHCKHKAALAEFLQPCPGCGTQLSLEEWQGEIERASLMWLEDLQVPPSVIVSDDEARRVLGEEYEIRTRGGER